MKIAQIVVEVKEGLPNYSSRTASVTATAEGDESLDIVTHIAGLQAQIKEGFRASGSSAGASVVKNSATPVGAHEAADSPESAAIAPSAVEPKRGRGRPKKEEPPNSLAASVVEDFFDE